MMRIERMTSPLPRECSTTEPHGQGSGAERFCWKSYGGGGWIRTIVGVSQQIYSLPPLATRAPLRRERMKLLLKDSKLSRVTDKNPAKRYQVAYHDGSTLINTLFNASF